MMCKVGKCVFLSLELYLSQLAVRLQPKGVDVNLEGIWYSNFFSFEIAGTVYEVFSPFAFFRFFGVEQS